MRGYSIIGLDHPKNTDNMGGVVRAAQIYGAAQVVIGSGRFKRQPTDAMKGYRHVPVVEVDDVLSVIPYDCVPIAVELTEDALDLRTFKHPERAFYIFGPEDGTLGQRILGRCRDVVKVPTNGPMNLAACVNVVLYDRLSKAATYEPTP